MGKLVVLIDGGWLKYSTRFAARARLGISNAEPLGILANHPSAQAAIYDVMAVSLRSKLGAIENNYGKIDRCIICTDIGVSWRSSISKTLIPGTEQASSIDYKGHRRTDDPEELAAIEKLNKVYKTCIDFICNNSGIEQVGKYGIEADDYMTILSRNYANQGDTVFIMATDADITQAVYSSDAGGRVIVLQPKQKGAINMVVDHATANAAKPTDIFNMTPMPLQLAQAIASAQIIAPQYMLLEKIVNGDASDDISPLMVRVSVTKTGKEMKHKTSAKTLAYLFDEIGKTHAEGYFKYEDLYDDVSITGMLDILHTQMFGTSFNDLPAEWQKFYRDKYEENRKMVCINKAELGHTYNEVLRSAVEQLHGLTPEINLPTWDILQRLNM